MEQLRVSNAHPQGAKVDVYVSRIPKHEANCRAIELMSVEHPDGKDTPFPSGPVKWLLSTYTEADSDDLVIRLCADTPDHDNVPDRIRFEVVMASGQPPRSGFVFMEWRSDREPLSDESVDGSLNFRFAVSLSMLQQAGYLHDDVLSLRVSVTWRQQQDDSNVAFLRRLGRVFDSAEFSDIAVEAQGRVFNVHRSILAVQSPVFRSMINASMSESINGRLEITDMDSSIARALLSYLYTGAVVDSCSAEDLPEGPWCIAHPFGYTVPSVMDLTRQRDQLEKKEYCSIRKQDESLFVQFQNGQTVVPRESSHTWKKPDDADPPDENEPRMIELSEWRIHLENRHYKTAILHCKDGELKFACFWGQLLEAADKYCVDDLLKQCAKRMVERLSVWSATTMLQFACQANQHILKQDIIAFITLTGDIFSDVRDTPHFDSLDEDLRDELSQVFVDKHRAGGKKRQLDPGGAKEFADSQDWARLSRAQLRRACTERELATGGSREEMVALLRAQEPSTG